MLNPVFFENTLPGGVGLLEVITGGMEENLRPFFVPLKRSELTGKVAGPLVSLLLIQVFEYTRSECNAVLEAVYRFPLPGDAAVTRVRVSFGAVEIEAGLQEREAAKQNYRRASNEGRQAILITREAPDVFTIHVAGIRPDEEIAVTTEYVQLACVEGAGWSLRVPLTIAPRYVRDDEVVSRCAHGQALLQLRDPGHRFSLDLNLEVATNVASSSHQLHIVEQGDGLRIRLEEGEVVPDRDLLLTWQPLRLDHDLGFQLLLHDDPEDTHLYFLALIAPPGAKHTKSTIPRELIVLVDHSGSMEGAKWEAANWTVVNLLVTMTDREVFNLGLFHHKTRWFARDPGQADQDTVAAAIRFLRQTRDSGGTELGVALEQALALPRQEGEYARRLLILTDAQVSDAARILRLATREAGRRDRRRISLICIDAAPNSFLALELAARGGGVARFLTSYPEQGDITTALDAILEDWAAPVVVDLKLEINRPGALVSGHRAAVGAPHGWSRIDLGDLPARRPLWAVGRVPRNGSGSLNLRLATASGQELARLELDSHQARHLPAIKTVFGARQVLGLEFLLQSGYAEAELNEQLRHLGYDPITVLTGGQNCVYPENEHREVDALLRGLLVREALYYGLASMETAFVAARREAGTRVEGCVWVGNALAIGWSESFLQGEHLMMPSFLRQKTSPDHVHEAVGYELAGDDADGKEELNTVIFAGIPLITANQAVLYDTCWDCDPEQICNVRILRRLQLRFPEGTPDVLDPGLAILIFVSDLTLSRAMVRLVDLVRQDGERPLNVQWSLGQNLRVVLVDPRGTWTHGAPPIEIGVKW